MTYPILIAMVLTSWAFMSLLAGERTRRANEQVSLASTKEAAAPADSSAIGAAPKAMTTTSPATKSLSE